VDGEITDSCFYVWDLLSVNDTDLRVRPYEIRYVHLTSTFAELATCCESANSHDNEGQARLREKMHSANAEGFVCKNRNAAYAGGRADSIQM